MDPTSDPRLRQELVQAHQAALREERAQERQARQARTAPDDDVRALCVAVLARCSAQETACFRRGAPTTERYRFELFRRAIVERDEAAWTALYTQYEDLVRHWLSTGGGASEEAVVVTFEYFWQAVDPATFARFPSLGAVLGYLKRCARTAAVRTARPPHDEVPLHEAVGAVPAGDAVEESVLEREDTSGFWRLLQTCCRDGREQAVLYQACVVGLSPRQIHRQHPTQFPLLSEIHQLKRNALARLRRRLARRARVLG
jgi:hypothetical protein